MSFAIVHTDGSCWPNPGGPGGWAAEIKTEGKVTVIKGNDPGPTTNNRMEVQAAIEALRVIAPGSTVEIWTDSQYLRNAGSTWIKAWKRHGWVTQGGTPVKNADLWLALDRLMATRQVTWRWVRSHQDNGNANDNCDAAANLERLKAKDQHLRDLLLNHGDDVLNMT